MCDPVSVLQGAAALVGIGGSTAAALQKPRKPGQQQRAKAPDEGLSDEERRQKLIAQMAAGASSGAGGGVGKTGSVTLGR